VFSFLLGSCSIKEEIWMANNPRLRGKIPHSEWPRIADRFASGESLTVIARSYGCTAPAIRYIVKRQPRGSGSSEKNVVRKQVLGPASYHSSRATHGGTVQTKPETRRPDAPTSARLWARVNHDIASFLAAMDDLMANESEANEIALLAAADRLLRASAITKVEIERLRSTRGQLAEAV
jgi:hypothetical protein